MFVDQADIEVFGGNGGDGCVSFRREKYIPNGGPDGGDGGDGGSVYLEATQGVDTLLDMVGRHHWRAQPGFRGMGKKMAGKDGEDLTIKVPPGTLVYDRETGILLADLKLAGQKICVAKGGRGGKGNIHFVTPVRQAPDFAETGRKGELRSLHLELRLIADVGLVGLPNAGKSTLLSRISAARPKIADYPFTTLTPQLGICELSPDRRLVIADIPGLIEGASDGAGLGHDFLRHIERTCVIVHLIDILPLDGTSPIDNYKQIRKELTAYSPKLAAKPEILAANKMDLTGGSEALADLRDHLKGKQIYAISAVTGTGLRPLLEALWTLVKRTPEPVPFKETAHITPPQKVEQPREDQFVYVEAPADEGDWEEVEVTDEPSKAAGGRKAKSDPKKTKRKTKDGERTMLTPKSIRKPARDRRTASERKKGERKLVDELNAKKAAPVVDAELAKEIAAIKADDVRKSKYYNRGNLK